MEAFLALDTTGHFAPRYVRSLQRVMRQATANPIHLEEEQSPQWQRFLFSLPQGPERHRATAARRVACRFQAAIAKGLCLLCWMPTVVCMCGAVPKLRPALRRGRSDVLVVLHPDEFLRTSNTGHIAAIAFDAPLAVWGLPEDDALLASMGSTTGPWAAVLAEEGAPTPPLVPAVLYPHSTAALLSTFAGTVGRKRCRSPAEASAGGASEEGVQEGSAQVETAAAAPAPPAVQLALLDGTWGQATVLNKQCPAAAARVKIDIAADYTGLFAPLRSQTRATGVSTLEALTLALEEWLLHPAQCTDLHDAATAGAVADRRTVRPLMEQAMRRFVNSIRRQKSMPLAYPADGIGCAVPEAAAVGEAEGVGASGVAGEQELQQYRVRRQRESEAATKALLAADTPDRPPLPPPVLNYCRACNMQVGWWRMVLHVSGKQHRHNLNRIANYTRPVDTD